MHLLGLVAVLLQLWSLATAAVAQDRKGAIKDLRVAYGTGKIAEAWFADPVTRYQHYVLGSNYEPETLVVRLKDGPELRLTLPNDSVFEDRQPRLADLDRDGTDEIVVVRSYLKKGAALVVIGVVAGQMKIIAETQPSGRPNTWLNPAGIADFDGDGQLDIAYVQMPHVLGRLRVVTLKAGKIVEIASIEDVSNHRVGSPHLGLAAVGDFNGDGVADLAIPTLDRMAIRVLSFKGRVREVRRYPLLAPVEQEVTMELGTGSAKSLKAGLGDGSRYRVMMGR